jgi:deoxyribodipyrimidine photo-lyase
MSSTAIWWIRRDLRLADNGALQAALAQADIVVPLFILDDAALDSRYHSRAQMRKDFMFGGLHTLDADLRARGSRLLVRQGKPVAVLRALLAECGADAIFAEADYTPFAVRRDAAVAQALPLTLTGGLTIHPPQAVRKGDGTPYTVFTPYSRTWRSLPLPASAVAAPKTLGATPKLATQPIPAAAPLALFPPGEAEAQRRLKRFAKSAIYAYAEGRNQLDVEGTSALSAYLRFGMISARSALQAARLAAAAADGAEARRGADTWITELIWREFYIAILHHFPHVLQMAFREDLRNVKWDKSAATLAAWQTGNTGYPVVDAAMRQLAATGWMHNRARMIVSSFLVKDLLLDWRVGEAWFMDKLVDGDPAANNGGWQWSAGVGTDAAPYFRVFSPVLQGQKFDPQGSFVRAWVPELARMPLKFLQNPWLAPADVQAAAGCRVGRDYAAPVVDHAFARARVLAAYKRAKS